ncbi:MAG: penicillin-binding protein [Clostridia bacterium]|nr:penicillin-binding protein [Clostridia bacterium]
MLLMICIVPVYTRSDIKLNIFSSREISQSIRNMEMNMTSVIYVKNSKGKWEEYQRLHGNENRIWVDIENMPKNLLNAFVAIEDERFYTHTGVDWKRTLGAFGNFVFNFSDTEFGGSTITQQLIKNVTMDNGRNAYRKFREIIRATLIEFNLEKEEILEAYLNTISLGNGICGVQVAANYYFNKDVSELSLVECAAIAAITKNPSKFNPLSGAEDNTERRNTVLDKMLELEKITEEEYRSAYDKELKLDTSQETDYEVEINSYFIDALIEEVIADLAEKYNCNETIASTMLYNGGYKIYATVDTEIQNIMEDVYLNTDKYFSLKGKDLDGDVVHVQSAMTIMDYEGHIVGIVGGAGEKTVNRGLNRATSSPRQPGSTMKPIGVYALAIENGLVDYTSRVLDKPIANYYPDGKSGPREWYGYYMGTIGLNYAIRRSANTIPVRLLKDLGVETSYDFLTNKLKFKYLIEEDKNLSSLALGGCHYGITTTESASAYAIFGNNGVFHEPTTYSKIENALGETIIEYDTKGEQVISPSTATIMNHLLQEVVYNSGGTGTGIRYYSNMKAFAKTGTSSESNDLWMVAGSPYYVGSVWYGFDMQQQIHSTSAAATVWKTVMKEVHKDLEKKEFTDSEDVYKKGVGYYKEGTKPSSVTYNSSSSSSSASSSSSSSSSQSSSSQASSSDTSSEQTSSDGTVTEPTVPQEPSTPSEPENPDGEASSEGATPPPPDTGV